MNKVLTISIPTYNRPDCLRDLVSKLCDAQVANLVEINVHDNSGEANQRLNAISCEGVNYYPNMSNVGYGGNIRACIKQATGQYLHIISDDDDYDFSDLISVLRVLKKKKPDALALTCSLSNNKKYLFNTLHNPRLDNAIKLGDILDTTKVVTPFNLLSSIIVKTSLMQKGMRLFHEGDSSYMHSIIFLLGLDRDAMVMFDESNYIITYNVPEEVQNCFALPHLLKSKEEITSVLETKFNVKRRRGLEILEVSKWCFMSGINSPKIQFDLRLVLLLLLQSLLKIRFLPIVFLFLGLFSKPFRYRLYQLHSKVKDFYV